MRKRIKKLDLNEYNLELYEFSEEYGTEVNNIIARIDLIEKCSCLQESMDYLTVNGDCTCCFGKGYLLTENGKKIQNFITFLKNKE
jgi:hypothetical protein